MGQSGTSALTALLLLSVWTRAGSGQRVGSWLLVPSPPQAPVPTGPSSFTRGEPSLGSSLLSLALPGAGQYREGRRRAWAYVALEAAAWTVHLAERAQGRRYRTQYRDLAWTNARVQASPRQEGDWAYYEVLTHWLRSGAYDTDPAQPGVQPEPDPASFNGAIWALARDIYFPPGQMVNVGDPAYTQALGYYEARAYGPSFLWDWSADPAAQVRYGQLIDKSDAGFRHATIALGAVFANHLVSAADAYLTGRGPGEASHVAIEPDPTGAGTRWTARVRIPVSR